MSWETNEFETVRRVQELEKEVDGLKKRMKMLEDAWRITRLWNTCKHDWEDGEGSRTCKKCGYVAID